MLHRAEDLQTYDVQSGDDEVGKVVDFYFDDRFWTVRYLVVETGGWFNREQVLVSPYAVAGVNEEDRTIRVNLSEDQIEHSPAPDTDPPVARQFEIEYHDYHGLPYYWYGTYAWGEYPQPLVLPPEVTEKDKESWDPYLRSAREVHGYRVQGQDGDIGHVSDFIIDGETWTIRYLAVDPRIWWPGKHVLMAPDWVKSVDWSTRSMSVEILRDVVRGAPEYDSSTRITREYETLLHRHYNSEGYWLKDSPMA
jgi:uncharacterized protein YrrD